MEMTTQNLDTHGLTATYSPEDNKLRLYSPRRLDAETYASVKAAGFIFAPKQDLFVAPMWTPAREDLLLSLCAEIGDEDTSLVDRAEQRADRFADYSDSRASDASRARDAVASIADGIPFGQPILVGHHSERRARKDAERIENNMRRAVKMWDQSEYWKDRAAGALSHAKYKDQPAVRARRIKGLESDKRKQERYRDEAQKCLAFWSSENIDHEKAVYFAGGSSSTLYLARKAGDREDWNHQPTAYDALTGSSPSLYAPRTLAEVIDAAKRVYPRRIAHYERWISHYENRIAYERAMLGEQGGLVAEAVDLQPGGRVLIGNEWLTIVRVNKKEGKPVSVSTNARYVRVRSIEEIKQYEAPAAEVAQAVAAATKLPPITNYPGEGFAEMTKAEWDKIPKDYKGMKKCAATATTGAHRYRTALGAYVLKGEKDMNKRHGYHAVFITDEKRKDAPTIATVTSAEPAAPVAAIPPPERAMPVSAPATAPAPRESSDFDAMRAQLKTGGVQVVSAAQLFPTPQAVASRMVELADLDAGHRVLEPEAGTGAILREIGRAVSADEIDLHAVEINADLAAALRAKFPDATITHGDFLQYRPEAGTPLFDRILMNPPFVDAQDIKHILFARTLLAPGGRLVAICANGPRQSATLKPLVEGLGGIWEPLPAGSFEASGTGVSTVLLVIDAE